MKIITSLQLEIKNKNILIKTLNIKIDKQKDVISQLTNKIKADSHLHKDIEVLKEFQLEKEREFKEKLINF